MMPGNTRDAALKGAVDRQRNRKYTAYPAPKNWLWSGKGEMAG